jgi:flagellar protein FlgJ
MQFASPVSAGGEGIKVIAMFSNFSTGAQTIAQQTIHDGLAADPTRISHLRQAARNGDAASLEATARAFESLLIGQMVRQLRATLPGDGLLDSDATKLYQDLFDQQLAQQISEGAGLGFREPLMKQLQAQQGTSAPDPSTLTIPERIPWLRSVQQVATAPIADTVAKLDSESGQVLPQLSDLQLPVTIDQWPPANAEEFVAILAPHAQAAGESLGFDPLVLLAQSALETGWGRHVPKRADGQSSYNLFGIKADRRWNGDAVRVGTVEFRDGVAQREQAKFRAYASPTDSFRDYVDFLRTNPRYGTALASDKPQDFVRGLQRAGYATDPQYANKILTIYQRLQDTLATLATHDSLANADTTPQG